MHTKRGPGPPIPGRRTPDGVGGGGGRRLRDTAGRALPRGRRENAGNQSPLPLIHDSSPRERGKRVDAVHPHAGVGLIPAHAGNTRREILYADPRSGNPPWASLEIIDRRKARAMGPAPAHPRAGVENTPRIPATASCCGSSPRGRGKLNVLRGQRPRPGSSPRVRGKLDGVDGGAGHVRLIPARAGKTRARPGRKRFRRAHPRACGENAGADPRCVNEVGSSPRVRGKQELPRIQAQAPGLIPARAGKTSTPTSKACPPKAHPRACGENSARHMRHAPPGGSSPRVRGKPGARHRHGGRGGLIPARAGKTGCRPRRPRAGPAHPRACGENVEAAIASYQRAGSSPRVRGKRLLGD